MFAQPAVNLTRRDFLRGMTAAALEVRVLR